ncbi:hypothetical protein OCOL_001743 [Ordospora colligata]|nr:hypothetical protein CWI40_091150 [Ordospora colligata]
MPSTNIFTALCRYAGFGGEERSDVRTEEIEMAVSEILKRARITDLEEYIRSYKYMRSGMNAWQEKLIFRSRRCLLSESVFRCNVRLLGHFGQVERVCFDQGNRFFMSGGADGMVKLWDAFTGFLVHSFIGHQSLVNDICVSMDGRLLVSCDSLGLLNVWSLDGFKLLFELRHECEIIFAEFFDLGSTRMCINGNEECKRSVYGLVVVLAKGSVKIYKIDETGVVDEHENMCLVGEIIKGICFTEGGRFLLCSGWWPFLVVFDMQFPEGCVILETNGMPVNTICGAKNGLKIAAACESQVFQWTFFSEGMPGMGNFKRRAKDLSLAGHWKKCAVRVEMNEGESIERMCYLKDNFLVCVCTDMKIRIFAGTELRCVIEAREMGVPYPHPLENTFVISGAHLRMYDMDKVVYEEPLNFMVNDAQFSSDGECFVMSDERGIVRVLTARHVEEPPQMQFFRSDLDHINSTGWSGHIECNNEATYGLNGEVNARWTKIEYSISMRTNCCVAIEDLGAKHFLKDRVELEAFRRKYMNVPMPGDIQMVSSQVLSSAESSEDESEYIEDTSSTDSEDEILQSSDEVVNAVTENRIPLRRFMIESESSSDEGAMLVRRAGMPEQVVGLQGRLRRFNRPVMYSTDIQAEDQGIRILRRNQRNEAVSRRRSSRVNDRNRTDTGNREMENTRLMSVQGVSGLTQYVQSWFSSLSLIPQSGDIVYVDCDGLRRFEEFESRKIFRHSGVQTGYYTVREVNIVRNEPPFVKVELEKEGRVCVIKYYRYPGWQPIMLLREQVEIKEMDELRYIQDGMVCNGRVVGFRDGMVILDCGGGSVMVDRSDVLVYKEVISGEKQKEILEILKQRRMYRNLYVTLRRESNTIYYENVGSTVNLGSVEERIRNGVYRTLAGLKFDLDLVIGNSVYLGEAVHGYCKIVVDEIMHVMHG